MKRDSDKNISSREFACKGGWEYNILNIYQLSLVQEWKTPIPSMKVFWDTASAKAGGRVCGSNLAKKKLVPFRQRIWKGKHRQAEKKVKNKKEAKTGQARDAVKATGIQRREVLRPITRLVCTCVLRPRLRRPCGAKSKERGRTIADVRRKQGGKGQQETPTLSAKKHTSHQGNLL